MTGRLRGRYVTCGHRLVCSLSGSDLKPGMSDPRALGSGYAHVRAQSLQSCSTFCDPTDCSRPGSSVHGILQSRILEWVAMPSSRGSSQPRGQTCISSISCVGRQVLYHWRHLGLARLWLHHQSNPGSPAKARTEFRSSPNSGRNVSYLGPRVHST